jgi:tellurite methyltransferase
MSSQDWVVRRLGTVGASIVSCARIEPMRRRIISFRQDDAGDWVAELSCLHRQHVRHRPPFHDRAWVLDDVQRRQRVGSELDCPLCDRAELPGDLVVIRTAGPFDAETLPPGLRGSHVVAAGSWGLLRILQGGADIDIFLDPPTRVRLDAGAACALPPEAPHVVSLDADAVIEIDFLARDNSSS